MEALEFLIALFIVVTLPTQENYRELISDYQDKEEVKAELCTPGSFHAGHDLGHAHWPGASPGNVEARS